LQTFQKIPGRANDSYRWIDIEQDETGRTLVERINHGKRIIPTIVFPTSPSWSSPRTRSSRPGSASQATPVANSMISSSSAAESPA